MSLKVSLSDIQEAYRRISGLIVQTPTAYSRSASHWIGTEVYFKFENQQMTGSFKIRGALNKILSLSEGERAKGLIASSAGNHAQGVALAATRVGARADIVMPTSSPIVKVMATQGYGANVILHGSMYDESYHYARQLATDKGLVFIHPYQDEKVIAGQGTLGLEMFEAVPDLDSVVISIGGGGLISGVATALKALNPKIRIYGCVAENAPGMFRMFRGQSDTAVMKSATIADGIAVKTPSREMFDSFISPYVDDIATVSDEEIAEAIVFLLERGKSVVEGSGAVTLAAAKKAGWNLGKKTGVVLSGGNIDLNIVSKVIERGLSRKGRLARLTVIVADRPGTLLDLTRVIAEKGANILDVKHDRLRADLNMSETAIEFLLETRSEDHVTEIRSSLIRPGVRLI